MDSLLIDVKSVFLFELINTIGIASQYSGCKVYIAILRGAYPLPADPSRCHALLVFHRSAGRFGNGPWSPTHSLRRRQMGNTTSFFTITLRKTQSKWTRSGQPRNGSSPSLRSPSRALRYGPLPSIRSTLSAALSHLTPACKSLCRTRRLDVCASPHCRVWHPPLLCNYCSGICCMGIPKANSA